MSAVASTSTKHKKDKSKKYKAVSTSALVPPSPPASKSEGVDPSWAYQPPKGTKLIGTNEDNGEFDWDAVNEDDDVELWVFRVPDSVKPRHLEGITLDLTSSGSQSSPMGKEKTKQIGSLVRHQTSYDLFSLDEAGGSSNVGGDELHSLTCLLPRKSKMGRLYPAPKPISKHIILSAQPPKVPHHPSSTDVSLTVHKNPPRHKYPPEALKHRFMPFGSLVNSTSLSEGDTVMAEVEIGVPEMETTVRDKPTSHGDRKHGKKDRIIESLKVIEDPADVDEVMEDAEVDVSVKAEKEKEKRKSKKRVKAVEDSASVDEAMQSVGVEVAAKVEKKKSKKRKGDEAQVDTKSSKKSKMAKTSTSASGT